MKLFLSWSGELSRQVASALREWLPYVIQPVKPFLSSGDISKGQRWGDVLAEELEGAKYGIICVTPYNIFKPWMNFEAGVLSKFIGQSAVTPFLFRVDQSILTGGPLSQFQSTVYSEDDVRALIYSINKQLGPDQVDDDILRREFDVWWKELKKVLDAIATSVQEETRTEYGWLYTSEDFAVYEAKADYKSVWVVTPDVFKRAIEGSVRGIVSEKLRGGVKYRYFLPASDGNRDDEMAQLKQMADSSQGRLVYKTFDRHVFDANAVTDYVFFNVDTDEPSPFRMFLKLPLENPGGEYWICVDERSAINLTTRFRALWDSVK